MMKTNCSAAVQIPRVGLGTWEASDPTQLEATLDAALEIGYRHYDTAFFYQNENVIGKVINKWISSGKLKREDVFITTKLPPFSNTPDDVETFMKLSLQNLGLDYVDLYLIHFPVRVAAPTNFECLVHDHKGVWQCMEKQVDAGLTRYIGVSNYNTKQIENILSFARIKPVCNQIELHLFLQQPELVQFCKSNNILVTAYSPLGTPNVNDFFKKIGAQTKKVESFFTHPLVISLAKKYDRTIAQIALRFLLQKGLIVIPKTVHSARLKENWDLHGFQISDSDMANLELLDQGEKGRIMDWKFLINVTSNPDYPFAKN